MSDRLSKVLLEFAEPLLGQHPTSERFHAVLDQVVLIWNLALLPDDAQRRYWSQIENQLRQGLPAHVVPEYLREMRAWLRWRKSHYGGDRRAISDYELSWKQGEPRLAVHFSDRSEPERIC